MKRTYVIIAALVAVCTGLQVRAMLRAAREQSQTRGLGDIVQPARSKATGTGNECPRLDIFAQEAYQEALVLDKQIAKQKKTLEIYSAGQPKGTGRVRTNQYGIQMMMTDQAAKNKQKKLDELQAERNKPMYDAAIDLTNRYNACRAQQLNEGAGYLSSTFGGS